MMSYILNITFFINKELGTTIFPVIQSNVIPALEHNKFIQRIEFLEILANQDSDSLNYALSLLIECPIINAETFSENIYNLIYKIIYLELHFQPVQIQMLPTLMKKLK